MSLLSDARDIFGHAFQVRLKERLLRDPLHGLIAIDENSPQGRLLVRVIDSAEFQRLRRIRQLGLSHYAFQGAEHSRFTHGVGAFHLTRIIADQLSRMYTIDPELSFYAQVAALVHDVGHGPFSHVSEAIFGERHETWTVRILHDDRTEIHQVLTDYAPNLPSIVESMLNGMAKPGYLRSLVSSQLDTDRFDYLLRDSLMTGVKYGVFDLDRMIHMLRISPEGDKIIVAEGGLGPVEKYVQARYHMYRQVYLHKTAVAAEAMLTALLRRACALIRDKTDIGLDLGSPLGRALSSPEDLEAPDYLEIDDITILSQIKEWAKGTEPVLSDISRRLLARNLFKTIEIDPMSPGFDDRMDQARGIVASAGLDPDYALLRVDSSDTPYRPYAAHGSYGTYESHAPHRTHPPPGTTASDHIYIENGRGGIVDVAQVSPTIRAFTQSAYTLSRLVFSEGGPEAGPHATSAATGSVKIRERLAALFSK